MQAISLGWIALGGGLLIPLVTGLTTKFRASSQLQAVVTFCLSSAVGATQAVLSAPHTGVSAKQLATTVAYTEILAIVTHYGLWKPTGISAAVQGIAPGLGLSDVSAPPLVTTQLPQELIDAIDAHFGAGAGPIPFTQSGNVSARVTVDDLSRVITQGSPTVTDGNVPAATSVTSLNPNVAVSPTNGSAEPGEGNGTAPQ